MDDKQIVDLYWQRSEEALTETAQKYGSYCFFIAHHILADRQDSEECVNDTYWKAWGSIPPVRPEKLQLFLGRITRNLALNRYKQNTAKKRRGDQTALALEELRDCVPAPTAMDTIVDDIVLADALDRFLASLQADVRQAFMRRYWYFSPVSEIAGDLGMTQGQVKMKLHRARKKLKDLLEQEGVSL